MENEQINVQSGKKTAKSWANYVSIALAALGLLFLLLLLVKYKDIEGNKHFYYIWDLFSAEKFQFMPLVGIILLVASIPLYVFGKRNTALPTAAFILQILAAVAFFLTPNMYVQSMGGKSCTMEVGLALAFACSMASAFFGIVYAYSKMPITVREMAEDGILVAAAVALNFLKIPAPEALTGGSINLQFLPLFILALRHGPLHGFIASGIAFGLITCLTDGYGFQYYPFDYLIGFGSAAVLGFFKPLILGKNQKTYNVDGEYFLFLGVLAATIVRMAGGMASSMVFYGYSFLEAYLYNLSYVPASNLIALIILMVLYGPLITINRRFPVDEQGN